MSLKQITVATAKKGWGYWDVTHYPYGGCFRRFTEDTPVRVIECANQRHESKVELPDKRHAWVDNRGLEATQ